VSLEEQVAQVAQECTQYPDKNGAQYQDCMRRLADLQAAAAGMNVPSVTGGATGTGPGMQLPAPIQATPIQATPMSASTRPSSSSQPPAGTGTGSQSGGSGGGSSQSATSPITGDPIKDEINGHLKTLSTLPPNDPARRLIMNRLRDLQSQQRNNEAAASRKSRAESVAAAGKAQADQRERDRFARWYMRTNPNVTSRTAAEAADYALRGYDDVLLKQYEQFKKASEMEARSAPQPGLDSVALDNMRNREFDPLPKVTREQIDKGDVEAVRRQREAMSAARDTTKYNQEMDDIRAMRDEVKNLSPEVAHQFDRLIASGMSLQELRMFLEQIKARDPAALNRTEFMRERDKFVNAPVRPVPNYKPPVDANNPFNLNPMLNMFNR